MVNIVSGPQFLRQNHILQNFHVLQDPIFEIPSVNVGFDHGLPCCVKNMARGTQ